MRLICLVSLFLIANSVVCTSTLAQPQPTEIATSDSKCIEENKAFIGKWTGTWSFAGPAVLEILSVEGKDAVCYAKFKLYLTDKDSKRQKIYSLILADGEKIKIPQTATGNALLWGNLDKINLVAELNHQWPGQQAGFARFKKE